MKFFILMCCLSLNLVKFKRFWCIVDKLIKLGKGNCRGWFHFCCNAGTQERSFDSAIAKGEEIDWLCMQCRQTSVKYRSCYRDILLQTLLKSTRRMKQVYPLVQRIIFEHIVLDSLNDELFDRPLQSQGSNWVQDNYSAQLLRRFRLNLSSSPISVPGDGNSASLLLCRTTELAL